MIKVKCAYCGKIYEAPTIRSVYCSDGCRLKAYKERTRKEKKVAEISQNQIRSLTRFVSPDDPARKLISIKKKYGILSSEYWQQYQRYALGYSESTEQITVNGVPVLDPDFAEKVIAAIKDDNAIIIE